LYKASTSVECSFKDNIWSLAIVWRVVIIAACFKSVCSCSVIVFVAFWQFLLMDLHGHQHVFWFYHQQYLLWLLLLFHIFSPKELKWFCWEHQG
jgi:Ca2+/H+ antiporter